MKLKRSIDFATYNRFIVEMINTLKGPITNVREWILAFNKASSAALKTQRNRYNQYQEDEPYNPYHGPSNDLQNTSQPISTGT